MACIRATALAPSEASQFPKRIPFETRQIGHVGRRDERKRGTTTFGQLEMSGPPAIGGRESGLKLMARVGTTCQVPGPFLQTPVHSPLV
ncbi:hypothetical protein VTK26DRAFT_6266 [Humicola hyalothermophila]